MEKKIIYIFYFLFIIFGGIFLFQINPFAMLACTDCSSESFVSTTADTPCSETNGGCASDADICARVGPGDCHCNNSCPTNESSTYLREYHCWRIIGQSSEENGFVPSYLFRENKVPEVFASAKRNAVRTAIGDDKKNGSGLKKIDEINNNDIYEFDVNITEGEYKGKYHVSIDKDIVPTGECCMNSYCVKYPNPENGGKYEVYHGEAYGQDNILKSKNGKYEVVGKYKCSDQESDSVCMTGYSTSTSNYIELDYDEVIPKYNPKKKTSFYLDKKYDMTQYCWGTKDECMSKGFYVGINEDSILLAGGITKEKCKGSDGPGNPENPEPCKPDYVTKSDSNKESVTCEDVLTYNSNSDSVTCDSETQKGFYSVNCDEKVESSFDLGADGQKGSNSLTLYSGEGFDYKIDLSIVKTCKGEFDVDGWNKSYDNIKSKRDDAKKRNDTKEVKRLDDIIKNLENLAETYKNWPTNVTTIIPNVSLELHTSPSIKISKFNAKVINEGNTEIVKATEGVAKLHNGVEVPKTFTYTNAKNPRTIRYTPPETKLDSLTGQIATASSTKIIDGGNRIYTDLETPSGTYPMTITLSLNSTGSSNTGNIINNKCSLNIMSKEKLYRIIDVTNPFVSKEYQANKEGNKYQNNWNWNNNKYNYTSIIDKNVWSNKSLYTFDLNQQTINDIKTDNNGNVNKYLGDCSLTDNGRNDGTKKMCNVIYSSNK